MSPRLEFIIDMKLHMDISIADWSLLLGFLLLFDTIEGGKADGNKNPEVIRQLLESGGLEPLATCGQRPALVTNRTRAHKRISNGNDAKWGQYPSFAHVTLSGNSCAGVLVGPDLVVGATHCLLNVHRKDHLLVQLGLCSPHDKDWTQEVEVSEIYHDARFCLRQVESGNYALNDLMLLRLSQRVVYSPYVQPACLAYNSPVKYRPEQSDLYYAAGMGVIDKKGNYARRLHYLALRKTCNMTALAGSPNVTDANLPNPMTCLVPAQDGTLCTGDSGGPLYYYRTYGEQVPVTGSGPKASLRQFVAGILSFGYGECEPKANAAFYNDLQAYGNNIRSQKVSFIKDLLDSGRTIKEHHANCSG